MTMHNKTKSSDKAETELEKLTDTQTMLNNFNMKYEYLHSKLGHNWYD